MPELTQLFTFLWFSLFCFGLAFVLADAHIFGCDAKSYEDFTREEVAYIGMLPLRPLFLRVRFFRELLKCYFCTGVWCGLIAHVIFRDFYGTAYWLWHESTLVLWVEGFLISAIVSATVCYVMDLIFKIMENKSYIDFMER